MSLSYIRHQFRVPAHRGRRISINGKRAVIRGASGDQLRVCFDGEFQARLVHPTDGVTYQLTNGCTIQWQAITAHSPAPLADVLVSTIVAGDAEALVFQAWRRATNPSEFLISGSETDVVPGVVYAYANTPGAAPIPKALEDAIWRDARIAQDGGKP